jgi:hypothetical protein
VVAFQQEQELLPPELLCRLMQVSLEVQDALEERDGEQIFCVTVESK